jgi:hypothetical protein
MQKYGNLSPPPSPRGVAELTPQGKPSPLPAPRLSACAKALADRRQAGVKGLRLREPLARRGEEIFDFLRDHQTC